MEENQSRSGGNLAAQRVTRVAQLETWLRSASPELRNSKLGGARGNQSHTEQNQAAQNETRVRRTELGCAEGNHAGLPRDVAATLTGEETSAAKNAEITKTRVFQICIFELLAFLGG